MALQLPAEAVESFTENTVKVSGSKSFTVKRSYYELHSKNFLVRSSWYEPNRAR